MGSTIPIPTGTPMDSLAREIRAWGKSKLCMQQGRPTGAASRAAVRTVAAHHQAKQLSASTQRMLSHPLLFGHRQDSCTIPLRTELEGFANDGTYLPHELWQVGRVTEQNAKEDKSVRDIRTTLYSYQEEGRESLRIYCREIK